jgi:signal transduction histidine kinase
MAETSLSDLFTALDVVVMQRVGPGTFFMHGTAPPWLRRVNARWKGERDVLISRTFPFLDHFLADAEAFWTTGEFGRVGSGLSSEPGADGRDFHFEAWAVSVDSGQYLLLEWRRDGEQLQGMLQRAREGLLEQERLERTQAALQRSQEQLRRAKEVAEVGSAARASLLATVSHEVRTPVHAIIGLAGLLLDSSLPPGQARFLSLIRSSSETLLAVLNDMLDASRLEAGALALETRAFDVRRTVDEALDVVAVRAAERGIDLNCQVDLAVPETVVGDPARLRQVLINLISNAVKFTPAGDVFVVAEAQDKGDEQVELHFAVKDEGPGIPADQLERLLAAPNEPDDAWTPRRGMGLSICRTLAERMGGRLWADAREGRGSTFHFTAHVAVAAGPSAPHLRAHQPMLDRRKVWILGGSPATQQLLINQTRFWGMVPRATVTMREVERWMADGPPDVALLDRANLEAPEALDRLAALPVIELVTLADAHQAAARPVAALLTKPLKCARLHAQLVNQLAAVSGQAAT